MGKQNLDSLSTVELERLLANVETGVPAGQTLYGIVPGDRVRVTATVNYKGPALSDTFYASIGNRIVFFDEIWKREVSFNWPATAFFLPRH